MQHKTQNFKELVVWQKAHLFVLEVYRYTKLFPADERYCLTQQFRRAAISIAANIAEGYKKKSKADKIRFFNIAEGSLEECRYYLILSLDLEYGANEPLQLLAEEISKLLNAYIHSIEKSM